MTDAELIEGLASRVMGWDVHDASAHRPGERSYPHVWRWRHPDGRRRLMVYTLEPRRNREFNPLGSEADAAELASASAAHGMGTPDPHPPLDTPEGRRTLCVAIAAQAPDPEAAAWHLWLNDHGAREEGLPPGVVAVLRRQYESEREQS